MEILRRFDRQDVVRPPEGFNSQLVWHLGQDQATSAIAEKLQFTPSGAELDFVLRATRRHPNTLFSLTRILGRSADFTFSPQTFFGISYDTVEIGGYGHQDFTVTENSVGVNLQKERAQLPSSDNFATKYPLLTATSVIDGKNEKLLRDAFSFSGAYTHEQAIKKVSANLVVAGKLAGMDNPPFIVPVPIAIGIYPTVLNEKGKPAYFIAWRVPYEGKRTGSITWREKKELADVLNVVATKAIVMAEVLRVFHDTFGLTHNQPHGGNYYVSDLDGQEAPPYLADFSTVYPISNSRAYLSRAQDMGILIIGTLHGIQQLLPSAANQSTLSNLYKYAMYNYLEEMPDKIPSLEQHAIHHAIAASMHRAMQARKFPRSLPTAQSWQRIQDLRKELEKAIAA